MKTDNTTGSGRTGARPRLESLLEVLGREEALLEELIELAREEQQALLSSDFPAIQHVSDRMLYAARRIDVLEEERESNVALLQPGATLEELMPLAEGEQVEGFGPMCDSLVKRLIDYRDIQERNAQLILASIKIRERWVGVLAGMAPQTYGSQGRGTVRQRNGLVSKSA